MKNFNLDVALYRCETVAYHRRTWPQVDNAKVDGKILYVIYLLFSGK
jgi:hypothetical protein